MDKNLSITDLEYVKWVETLSIRYRQSQLKAAIRVNRELLRYYWELGRDIETMQVEERWGEKVIKNLSADLQHQNPNASGLSRTNIYYAKKFYLMYSPLVEIVPQPVGQLEDILFSLPWGHHRCLMDKLSNKPEQAIFFVRKAIEELEAKLGCE